MTITIQSVNFKADSQLEYFITNKVRKLFRYSDAIIRAEVTLREAAVGVRNNKQCDIRLLVPGNDHLVSKASGVYEKSVLDAVRTMQQLMRNSKPARVLHKARRSVREVFKK